MWSCFQKISAYHDRSPLRSLLPAEMYASMWGNPSVEIMIDVHKHLRTLQRILHDYTSRQISINSLKPGDIKPEWKYGTMMFTDLPGFTKLMEANASKGRDGASDLLYQLNKYFFDDDRNHQQDRRRSCRIYRRCAFGRLGEK